MNPVSEIRAESFSKLKESQRVSILIFTGHSGGHLFPAVAFAESYKESHPGASISLITSEKGKVFLEERTLPFEEIDYLAPFPFPKSIFSVEVLIFLKNLIAGFVESFRLIRRLRPSLCIGFGSYASFPGILMSAWFKIPTLIHEQNRVYGKATRELMKFVDCVGLAFHDNLSVASSEKVHFVGLPIRNDLLKRKIKEKVARSPAESFCLLVTGGSQGARRLNEIVLSALSLLNNEEKKKLAVNHITGFEDSEKIRSQYLALGIQANICSFSQEMGQFYQEADMAITRAGSNTLFELACFQIPAVVIPYPHASSHQSANAQYFADQGAVLWREEKELTPDWLLEQIRLLSEDSQFAKEISQKISSLSTPGAANRLVSLADQLIGEYQK